MSQTNFELSSFRDPSGFLFKSDGNLFRQINNSYRDDYDQLMSSGLYEALIEQGLMVPHEEVFEVTAPHPETACKIIKP
ncbi:MAG TPA: nodulation protein NoeA, partial [Clostridiales bacterium]|nr:nodulation protein NoeA [Clostridiales bacterium]